MLYKYALLLLCFSTVNILGSSESDAGPSPKSLPKPKAKSKSDPVSKAESKSKTEAKGDSRSEPVAEADAKTAIIAHHGTPLPPPIPPIHGPQILLPFGPGVSSTPVPPLSPIFFKNKLFNSKFPKIYAHPRAKPAYGHPNNPIVHPIIPPHPGYAFKYCQYPKPPLCSLNTTKPWCLGDYDYPLIQIEAAIHYHKEAVLSLYADVADLSAENSVIRPLNSYEETYLCSSDITYARPVRAVNTDGVWRIIVNKVKVDYEIFTQTIRIEECLSYGKPCSLVPSCYDSRCVQKSVYHRFLVFDPCDHYFPFAIETFKLPSACSCIVGELYL